MKGHVKSLVFPDEPGFPPFWNSVSPTSCLFTFFFMATQSTAGVSLDEPIFPHSVLYYFCYHNPKNTATAKRISCLDSCGLIVTSRKMPLCLWWPQKWKWHTESAIKEAVQCLQRVMCIMCGSYHGLNQYWKAGKGAVRFENCVRPIRT